MLFQRHSEIFADVLGRSLAVQSLHAFVGALQWRSTRRREKQMRDNAANDSAVKARVIHQIGQDWPSRGARHCQLHWPLAKTFLELVEIDIEPRTRIADDDNGFRFNSASRNRPEIFVVVQC